MKGKEPENPMPLLRDRLHGLESDAPGLGWDAFLQHRKKRRLVVWWYFGFVVLALLATSAFFIGYRKSAEKHWLMHPKQATKARVNPMPNQETRQTSQASSGLIARAQPEMPQLMESSGGNPIAPNLNSAASIPATPGDSSVLPDLPSRPLKLLSESDAQPHNRLAILEVERPKLYPADSWQWHWGLSMGAGLFRPVTQANPAGQVFIHRDYTAIRRKFEVGLFSQNLRLQIAALKGNWMLTAGIGIHHQVTQANYDFMYSEAPVIDRDGRIIAYATTNPQRIAFNSIHSITSTELPVSMAWRWKKTRDYSLYLRLGVTPTFLGSIKGILPDPVLLDRREKLSPVNYRVGSQTFSIALPLLLKTGTNGRLELYPEWKWHSGLRQVQGHYLSRFNQSGISCSYYVRF